MPDIAVHSHQNSWFKTKLNHLFWRLISGLPDRPYLSLKYFSMAGRFPNLDQPRLFSEKVQTRKLYDRNPLYPTMVDKLAAKSLIADLVGNDHVIPTYWVGRDLRDVNWQRIKLPVVVKPTHASGFGAFLRTQADIDALLSKNPSRKWLSVKYDRINREWAYGAFQPEIIIEQMLVENDGAPDDFRFFVFSGRISHIELRLRRDGQAYECNYTPDWRRMEFDSGFHPSYPGLAQPVELPAMIKIVKSIARDSDFMRVDLYLSGDRIYVGELTIYPGGGFRGCVADEYDEMLGAMWQQKLPSPSV
jgi:hypothetical protein